MRWGLLLGLVVSVGCTACGEGPDVRVRYDGEAPQVGRPSPAPLATVPPTVAPAVSTPSVVATVPPSPQPPSPEPTPAASPAPSADGIRVRVVFEGGDFFPRIRVDIRRPDGTPLASDVCSEDGRGISRALDGVKAGDYFAFRVYADELARPYYEKVLRIAPDTGPTFYFGSISFLIPDDLAARLGTAVSVRVHDAKSGDAVFSGKLRDLRCHSVYGDAFPHMLVLEPGVYGYTVVDDDPADGLGVTDGSGGPGVLEPDKCRFEISKAFPRAVVDLRGILGTLRR